MEENSFTVGGSAVAAQSEQENKKNEQWGSGNRHGRVHNSIILSIFTTANITYLYKELFSLGAFLLVLCVWFFFSFGLFLRKIICIGFLLTLVLKQTNTKPTASTRLEALKNCVSYRCICFRGPVITVVASSTLEVSACPKSMRLYRKQSTAVVYRESNWNSFNNLITTD